MIVYRHLEMKDAAVIVAVSSISVGDSSAIAKLASKPKPIIRAASRELAVNSVRVLEALVLLMAWPGGIRAAVAGVVHSFALCLFLTFSNFSLLLANLRVPFSTV